MFSLVVSCNPQPRSEPETAKKPFFLKSDLKRRLFDTLYSKVVQIDTSSNSSTITTRINLLLVSSCISATDTTCGGARIFSLIKLVVVQEYFRNAGLEAVLDPLTQDAFKELVAASQNPSSVVIWEIRAKYDGGACTVTQGSDPALSEFLMKFIG